MDFYDSTQPQLIPAGTHACLYGDGEYAATGFDTRRFAAVRWITVDGSPGCGIADYEQGNPVFDNAGALRTYVERRTGGGHRARVYSDLSNLPAVRDQLKGLDYLVWLSTLDGNKLSKDWTPGLWGVQFAGGPTADYDTSVLYGVW